MKLILLLTLLSLLAPSISGSEKSVDMIEGILVGALGDIGHYAHDCITDSDSAMADIQEGMKYLQSVSGITMAKGFVKIGEAIEQIPTDVQDCDRVKNLVKHFDQIAEQFEHPVDLVIQRDQDIVWKGVSIYT